VDQDKNTPLLVRKKIKELDRGGRFLLIVTHSSPGGESGYDHRVGGRKMGGFFWLRGFGKVFIKEEENFDFPAE